MPVLYIRTQKIRRAKTLPQILHLFSARARTWTQVHPNPDSMPFCDVPQAPERPGAILEYDTQQGLSKC